MKKRLIALVFTLLALQTTITVKAESPAVVLSKKETTIQLSDMKNLFQTTERPDLDEFVFQAFDKIDQERDSGKPIIVYTGDYESCRIFRDYFNYAYGFTYDFRLLAYRTDGSGDYNVAFYNTENIDDKIDAYLKEVSKAKEIAASLYSSDYDTTVYQVIHWVKDNIFYNYSLHGKASEEEMLRSYYQVYSNRNTICKGYSTAVYQLCSINGVKATLETGTYNGGGHAWNTVTLKDGSLIYVDTTNNQSMISTLLPSAYVKQ